MKLFGKLCATGLIGVGLLIGGITLTRDNTAQADVGSWGYPLPYPTSLGGLLLTNPVIVPTNNAGTLGSTNIALAGVSRIVTLRPGAGMAIMAILNGTAGSFTSNTTFNLAVSMDGTNFSSTVPSTLSASFPLNAGTAVTGAYYFASSVLDGYRAAQLGTITTAATNAGGVTVSNVTYRFNSPQ